MIKTDTIKISTKGCRKLKYFKSLGYKIIDDFIEVNIKDLNPGSREVVSVKCDYCDNDVDVTYKEYLRNIKIGNKFACSKKCGSIKAKTTFTENYGVEHPLKLEEFRKKQVKTN